MGETMFGDYNQWMGDDTCHSVTNYECYKGLWSSMNSANMHEVAYAMNRQSGSDPWCLYTGRHLLDFLDNHDVTRIATQLDDKRRLTPLYGLLFGMPGVPCVYYGSEWGMEGEQRPYEHEIRPEVEAPEQTDLTRAIAAFAAARARSEALCDGSYREVACQPLQLVFERAVDGERVLVAMNAADSTAHLDFDAGCGQAVDLVSGDIHDFGGGSDLPPFSCAYWRCER
jgi:glycosidase